MDGYEVGEGQLADAVLLLDSKLAAHPKSAREARQTIQKRVGGLDAESLDVLRLLTSELVANSARHAGLRPTDQVGLQVRTKRDWVRVEVIDQGRKFEPRIPLSKTFADGSGWGLYIVNRLADRWGTFVRSPHRHVWFELQVPIAAPGDAPPA